MTKKPKNKCPFYSNTTKECNNKTNKCIKCQYRAYYKCQIYQDWKAIVESYDRLNKNALVTP